jgi:hypothetical protein
VLTSMVDHVVLDFHTAVSTIVKSLAALRFFRSDDQFDVLVIL